MKKIKTSNDLKNTYRYKNILLFGSPQFSGNISEYFIANTQKLVLYITMPRLNNKFNIIYQYEKGEMISEEKVISSGNIFLYYFYWYVTYIRCLFKYYKKHEDVFVITWQPFFFFAMNIQRLFRNVRFVYWIGDYFPPISLTLSLYEKIKKYYATKITYVCYLSDRINEKMNGKILNTSMRRTVMWGVNAKNIKRNVKRNSLKILFVGLIKPSQGVESILSFLKANKDYKVKIIGICEQSYYLQLQKMIKDFGIAGQVYFPNRFLPEEELEKETIDCHVGIALYDVTPMNATYYADPGKIKTYAQYGLPILMTPIADIEKYVKKFSAGEIVSQDAADIEIALKKMKKNYKKYEQGIAMFNEYFEYDRYYKKRLNFLEN